MKRFSVFGTQVEITFYPIEMFSLWFNVLDGSPFARGKGISIEIATIEIRIGKGIYQ